MKVIMYHYLETKGKNYPNKKISYNSKVRKYYKNKDFSENSIKKLKQNFKKHMLIKYINDNANIDKNFKIKDLLNKYY